MAEYDKVIPAGQSGKITASLDTKKYRGELEKTIIVISNDLKNPKATVTLQCRVLGIKILPAARAYFNAQAGSANTEELTLATMGEGPLTIYTKSSNPNVIVKLEKLTDNARPESDTEYWQQYKLLVTIPENFPDGRFAGKVTLVTDSMYDPSVSIPVAGMVHPSVVVSPKKVRMPVDKDGNIMSRIIRVTKKHGTSFKISKLITEPKALNAELKETQKGKQYTITLNWIEAASSSVNKGKVVLYTNDKKMPIITVPVAVYRR